MLQLKNFRDKSKGLPDLLNYAAVIDDGVVLCKDAALMCGFFYRGEDIASSTPNELNYLSAKANRVLARFGSGWMIHVDAMRMASDSYDFPNSHFPEPISKMIDEERKHYFQSSGTQYESMYSIVLTHTPPSHIYSKFVEFLYDDDKKNRKLADAIVQSFKDKCSLFESEMSSVVKIERLKGQRYTDEIGREHIADKLLQLLNYAITGRNHPINLPPCGMYLDSVIGSHRLWNGLTPKLEDKFFSVVAIDGFPDESYPAILSSLDNKGWEFRWSSRFIYMDPEEAKSSFRSYQRKWDQKKTNLIDQILNRPGKVNQDAVIKSSEIDHALAEIESGDVKYGYYTSVVVLRHEDRDILEERSRELRQLINNLGFDARIEDINSIEAFLGSLPGHGVQNVRRPAINTMNLADLLPLSAIWSGRSRNPSPKMPKDSPSLFQAVTHGSTAFRGNIHVGDLGHTLIFGPPGQGKSTLLAFICAQYMRYRNAKIFAFDKGNSLEALTSAVGGGHYHFASDDDTPQLCPLSHVNSDGEQSWAEEWIKTLCGLQKLEIRPSHSKKIHEAMSRFRNSEDETLTDFVTQIQDLEIKEALAHYTLGGSMGKMLDSKSDLVSMGNFQTFEMGSLMNRGDVNVVPVLTYLFHRIEMALDGNPALLSLDESWLFLSHPVFREKIEEWFRVLRKANCPVVLATQAVGDVVKSGMVEILTESCATKIFLPNPQATKSEESMAMYRKLGLNDAQINIIATAIPKRQYYLTSADGNRLFELGLSDLSLSFLGVSGQEELRQIRLLKERFKDKWPYKWLDSRGVSYEKYIN